MSNTDNTQLAISNYCHNTDLLDEIFGSELPTISDEIESFEEPEGIYLSPNNLKALVWFAGHNYAHKIECLTKYGRPNFPHFFDILRMYQEVFPYTDTLDPFREKNTYHSKCITSANADVSPDSNTLTLPQAVLWWNSIPNSVQEFWQNHFDLSDHQCEIPEVLCLIHFQYVTLKIEDGQFDVS